MILVSVIIPTYNYARYIGEAVNSVLSQATTELKIEIIVVDDGSTDNTKAVLQQLIDAGKVKYVFQRNQGKAAATRNAVALATGKYLFNLDADDFFLPKKIAMTVAAFEATSALVHVGSVAKVIDGDGKHISTENHVPIAYANKSVNGLELATYFLKNNTLWGGGTTYAVRTDVIKNLPIPDDVDMYLDEYLILGILEKGDSLCFTDPLSIWRVHGKNYSNTTPEQRAEKDRRSLRASAGTLNALKAHSHLPDNLLKLYAFKHETRRLASLEDNNTKTISEIWAYGRKMLQLRSQGVAFFRRYTSFNRLLPTPFLHFSKAILSR
jgi:glycosyltransferase involved in cell wall biosynthesis